MMVVNSAVRAEARANAVATWLGCVMVSPYWQDEPLSSVVRNCARECGCSEDFVWERLRRMPAA